MRQKSLEIADVQTDRCKQSLLRLNKYQLMENAERQMGSHKPRKLVPTSDLLAKLTPSNSICGFPVPPQNKPQTLNPKPPVSCSKGTAVASPPFGSGSAKP